MDPFQINAAYRQNELLDEARADGLLKTARSGRPTPASGQPRSFLARVAGSPVRLSRPRSAARKATA